MVLIEFIKFLAFLFLSLTVLRLIQINSKGSVQKALSFTLH